MTDVAEAFRVRADDHGSEPRPWGWSVHQVGLASPFMRSTLTFASRGLAMTAGKKALADFLRTERRAEARAREP